MSFVFDSLFNDPFDDFFPSIYGPMRLRHHMIENPIDKSKGNKKSKTGKNSEKHDELTLFDDHEGMINPFYGFGRMDIKENKDNYEVSADLPGMEKDDINVELKDNVLTLSCERKGEKKEDDDEKNYHYYERHFGSYKRSMAVPTDVDVENVKADYTNGVLKLSLPKTKTTEMETKKITIN
ncbi:hypothetical protein WA158_000010 [Blastocystis sp. Blastoise]